MLSPVLFFVLLDWVTRKTYGKGIQWILTSRPDDLDFADEYRLQNMEDKLDATMSVSSSLKINRDKTTVLRTKNTTRSIKEQQTSD